MQRTRVSVALLIIVVLGGMLLVNAPATSQQAQSARNRVLEHNARADLGLVRAAAKRQRVSGGVVVSYLEATGRGTAAGGVAPAAPAAPAAGGTVGCPNVFAGAFPNRRVNQDCSFRRQAEEVVAVNPTNINNLVAGQNDSRIGFNHCGYDWSFNKGSSWGDLIPPFWQFLQSGERTADACSDPTATFDSVGNVYVGGVLFNLASAHSSFVVAKSNAPNGGSFYHSPLSTFATAPLGVVADSNDPLIFHDKEFIVADATASSPKANYVYGTWTLFDFNVGAGLGQKSPIYFSQSTDGGATWSPGVEISGRNPALCTAFSNTPGDPSRCDQDQGSHPIVGPDGTIYVVFGNGNTPTLGINQVLFVKCGPAADCRNGKSWSTPTKVGDLVGTHPLGPDPATGCPAFRQCIPPNGYRAPEFTGMSISADPTNLSRLFVSWWDTRNIGANCDFDGGTLGSAVTAVPPCDTDIFLSISTNGGATWGAAINISDAAGNDNNSSQWQGWSAVAPNGTLYIAYYDRKYGNCEFTGCHDITLAHRTPTGALIYHRITTASMPNLLPSNNPFQAGFLGDYMWVATDSQNKAHIVWADTRGRLGTVEEDIYYARFPN